MSNFAIIGVGGYIAPRHLAAIKELGHNLIIAYDKNDSVGILDRYFPECYFFTDFERFEVYFDQVRDSTRQIDFVSVCTPNYLHASHVKFGLSHGAHVICEKPLVLNLKELDELVLYSKKYKRNVSTVQQLRVHQTILDLKNKIEKENRSNYQIDLKYMTSRGSWFNESWKGDCRKSGGLSTNIGVHFFDMLTWIFGDVREVIVSHKSSDFESGLLKLEKASVKWELTIDRKRIPDEVSKAGKSTFRSILIDGLEFEFSEGFSDLHQQVYSEILAGRGCGLDDVRAATSIVEKIRGM
jgi:UDP-N-acetyl-2-amino-2-deoxyglucuronate dehydrogenase